MLIISYKTNIALSFTHSRLVKQKAGPAVAPGTFPLEGDLAESWTQPNETTYVFKLRRGVRWHNKPPVNGRELTADDVKYSLERFMTVKGNSNAYMLKSVDKVEAVDKYTVRITLKEPFAWLLDMLASPMAVAIVAKEVVEKFGDLKKPEAVIGTGPWMLDSYRPNQGYTLVRNPTYFQAGLPYIDRVEVVGRRGQRLPHRRLPQRQVRHRLGEPGHHQPHGLGADQGQPQAEAAQSADVGVPVEPADPHLDAHRPEALQRPARASGHLHGARPPGHPRRRGRGRGLSPAARAGRPQGLVAAGQPDRRGGQVLPARSGRGQEAAGGGRLPERLSRPPCASPPTDRPFWSTRCSSCSST